MYGHPGIDTHLMISIKKRFKREFNLETYLQKCSPTLGLVCMTKCQSHTTLSVRSRRSLSLLPSMAGEFQTRLETLTIIN